MTACQAAGDDVLVGGDVTAGDGRSSPLERSAEKLLDELDATAVASKDGAAASQSEVKAKATALQSGVKATGMGVTAPARVPAQPVQPPGVGQPTLRNATQQLRQGIVMSCPAGSAKHNPGDWKPSNLLTGVKAVAAQMEKTKSSLILVLAYFPYIHFGAAVFLVLLQHFILMGEFRLTGNLPHTTPYNVSIMPA